jgi:class 3 adenylate cyclase
MDKDKFEEVPSTSAVNNREPERVKLTILFSDIRGSTKYAEDEGTPKYMAMINRHNALLFPVIEGEGGRVVKTMGDAILAKFDDRVAAVRAAVGMQRILAKDRAVRDEVDHIHIRIGLHYGWGIITENDVYGDVVNAASRVQHQAEAGQILITDFMMEAATAAGFECAPMGRAELRGKGEPIELYAVAWSESAAHQLLRELQKRYERKLEQLEQEFEHARSQWRAERRSLTAEIEHLEEALDQARQLAHQQFSEDLHSELRFQLEQAIRARHEAEKELSAAIDRFEGDRNSLKAQIDGMQASLVDSMERTNNPARMALALREQLELRLAEAKLEWQLQWEGERKRYIAEIERLKKALGPVASEEKKEAARRALREKLGKSAMGSSGPILKSADQWERDFQESKIEWDTEREQLKLKIHKLESDLERVQDSMRAEIFQEIRSQYEPRVDEISRARQRLEYDLQAVTKELAGERERLNERIKQLEKAIPEAQEAARKQALAELQGRFDAKLDDVNRLRARMERKQRDAADEIETERRRSKTRITALEEELTEAKAKLAAFKAQKGSTTIDSSE